MKNKSIILFLDLLKKMPLSVTRAKLRPMKIVITILCLFVFSCKKEDELTGKTAKGELKSPCVSTDGGPCSNRFNPNFV